MIKQLTGTDEAAGRRCLSGLQVLIKQLTGADQLAVLYCVHLCMKCSLDISNFLEEISSLSQYIVFLYFFALITEESFLISPCYSLELCIQMLISFLSFFTFSFSS